MRLTKIWGLLLACGTLAAWSVWVALGHASWPMWYLEAIPAAMVMGLIGLAIGHILDHPHGPYFKVNQTTLNSKTVEPTEDNAETTT